MEKKIILFAAIALTAFIGTVVVAQIFRARPTAASAPNVNIVPGKVDKGDIDKGYGALK